MKTARLNDSVHYVAHGTPFLSDGTQAYASVCRAADVTETDPDNVELLGLYVKNPSGQFFHSIAMGGCVHDVIPPLDKIVSGERSNYRGGSWHWPDECVYGR